MSFITLFLTCANQNEANAIAQALLERHLIACAKQIPCASQFWWQGKIDHHDEILLMMESSTDKFEEIEVIVQGLHSYETFVLTAVPIIKISKRAEAWLNHL